VSPRGPLPKDSEDWLLLADVIERACWHAPVRLALDRLDRLLDSGGGLHRKWVDAATLESQVLKPDVKVECRPYTNPRGEHDLALAEGWRDELETRIDGEVLEGWLYVWKRDLEKNSRV
jgi:hypothetical protein